MCRFGGGFTSWTQAFRLKHLVTGRYLAVNTRTEVSDESQGSDRITMGAVKGAMGVKRDHEGVRRGSAECRRRWKVCLVDACKAEKELTAFCFTKATVSELFPRLVLTCRVSKKKEYLYIITKNFYFKIFRRISNENGNQI